MFPEDTVCPCLPLSHQRIFTRLGWDRALPRLGLEGGACVRWQLAPNSTQMTKGGKWHSERKEQWPDESRWPFLSAWMASVRQTDGSDHSRGNEADVGLPPKSPQCPSQQESAEPGKRTHGVWLQKREAQLPGAEAGEPYTCVLGGKGPNAGHQLWPTSFHFLLTLITK